MKSSNARTALGVCLLALGGLAAAASIGTEPVYNPSTEVRISAVVTGARQVPAGSPMAGQHLLVQTKNGTADVYLGPVAFLKIFKTDFPAGAPIQVIGARVAGSNEAILAREVTEGTVTLTLREFSGAPVWEHWGVIADSSASGG